MPLQQIDYVLGSNYPGAIAYLPLKRGASPTKLSAHVQEGLHRLFEEAPWLNGQVHGQSDDAPDWRPDRLEVRYTLILVDSPSPHQFRFQKLEANLRRHQSRRILAAYIPRPRVAVVG